MKKIIEKINKMQYHIFVTEEHRPFEKGPFKGFTAKRGMFLLFENEDDEEPQAITWGSVDECGQVTFFLPLGKQFNKYRIYANEIDTINFGYLEEESNSFYEKMEFESRVKQALEIPLDERAYLKEKLTLTDVVPGEKCNNGGEYGFYTHIEPTNMVGIFRIWTSCTCDFDLCGTDGSPENGDYVVLTKTKLDEMIKKSDEIEEAGSQY